MKKKMLIAGCRAPLPPEEAEEITPRQNIRSNSAARISYNQQTCNDLVFATLALVTVAMAATALAITMAAAALVTITMTTAAALMLTFFVLLAIALAVIAIAAATTAARAAHLAGHSLGHFLISRSAALFNGNAKILVHNRQHFIKLLTCLQKALTYRVVNHILTQLVERGNFFIGRGHTLHVLIAQLLAVLVDLTEEVGSLGVLVEKADAGFGRHNFLALSKTISKLSSKLHKFRCE